MSTVLFTVSVMLFIDLILTDLIFKISSDEFINLSAFKTVLMNDVWWWEWQKFKDLLLHFFIFVWVHSLDCNIVRMYWCLECYMYRNCWQSHQILNERYSRRIIFFILFDNHDVAVVMLSLLCHLQDVMREKHQSEIWSLGWV